MTISGVVRLMIGREAKQIVHVVNCRDNSLHHVAEELIHFVDNNVAASELITIQPVGLKLLLNELRATSGTKIEGIYSPWRQLLDQNRGDYYEGRRIAAIPLPKSWYIPGGNH